MIDGGITWVQIAKPLPNVLSQRTVRQWPSLYKTTSALALEISIDRP
jgi:hypothetical protein